MPLQGQSTLPLSGLQLADGWTAVAVADDRLADNVYSIAASDDGRLFVSGPGYIRQLVDEDEDGTFDSAVEFSNTPRSGAQGMLIEGDQLWCTGDQGLLRYQDADGNGRADGPPECVLPLKTGGEHTSHAIRRGPEGDLYVLCGNQTPLGSDVELDSQSPVAEPRAGYLLRLTGPQRRLQIIAHGFRNAYDFDFDSQGRIFVYDSDGERDIGLPWYRPTRVFQIRPGDDAGWVGVGWKRPSDFFDMPHTVAELGRGSPTGVRVISGLKWSPAWQDSVIVADWTFGRVIALLPTANGTQHEVLNLAQATGQLGFAVTDLELDAKGRLLVSVGGRGTQSAIYALRPPEVPNGNPTLAKPVHSAVENHPLAAWLNAPAPRDVRKLEPLVGRPDVGQRLAAEEALAERMLLSLAAPLGSEDPAVAGLALRVARLLPEGIQLSEAFSQSNKEVQLLLRLALATSDQQRASLLIDTVESASSTALPLRHARIAQLTLLGCATRPSNPMWAGYEPEAPLVLSDRQRRRLAETLTELLNRTPAAPEAERRIADEWGRLAAMLQLKSSLLAEQAMRKMLDAQSQGDLPRAIHWLNVIARLGVESKPGLVDRMASFLAGLTGDLEEYGISIDRNFFPRVTVTAKRLVERWPTLSVSLAQRLPPRADNEPIYMLLRPGHRQIAADKLKRWLDQHPSEVQPEHIRILARTSMDRYGDVIRSFGDQPELAPTIIAAVAAKPDFYDLPLLIQGLGDPNLDTLRLAAEGLTKLSAEGDGALVPGNQGSDTAAEVRVQAVLRLERLPDDGSARTVADALIRLLRATTGEEFGFPLGVSGNRGDVRQQRQAAIDKWSAWVRREYAEPVAQRVGPPPAALLDRLNRIDFESGVADSGQVVFRELRCAQCHDQGTRLGPRLAGVTKRFSQNDLFRSIVEPHRDVPPRYQTLLIETVDGQLIQGSAVYDSVAGTLLQLADGSTALVRQDDILERVTSKKSLMPEGLLDQASDQQWADLWAYLKTL